MIVSLLKNIAKIQVGYQARFGIKESRYGTHRLVQGKDFDSSWKLRTDKLIVFSPEKNPEHYMLKKGDILFQARGRSHFAYCIEEDLEDTLAAGTFYIIRPKVDVVFPAYLAWWINQNKAQAHIRKKSGSTDIPFVSKTILDELEVHLPSLHIQHKIKHVEELWTREKELRCDLTDRRSRLVQALCMKLLRSQGAL